MINKLFYLFILIFLLNSCSESDTTTPTPNYSGYEDQMEFTVVSNIDSLPANYPKTKEEYFNRIKGKYYVKGMNHKLNVSNKMIGRIGNKMFKDMLNLGDEIIFTFDLNKKNVEIEVGQKVMQNKYN